MKTAIVFAILAAAAPAAAQQATSPAPVQPPKMSLDHFDAQHGFPTFPKSTVVPQGSKNVPVVFNGPNVNSSRINDVTKITVINKEAPKGTVPR